MIAERGRGNDTFQRLGDQQPVGGAVLCMRDFLGVFGGCGRFGGGGKIYDIVRASIDTSTCSSR